MGLPFDLSVNLTVRGPNPDTGSASNSAVGAAITGVGVGSGVGVSDDPGFGVGVAVTPGLGIGVATGVGAGVWPGAGVGVGVDVPPPPPPPDTGVGVATGVGGGVATGVGVGVTAATLNQLVLLPLSIEFAGLIMVGLRLFESFTSTNDIFLAPVGFTFHCVPKTVLLSFIRFPDAPVSVHAPVMVCVLPASKFSCLPAWVLVKFTKVAAPVMAEVIIPVNATVPAVPGVNVPVFDQLPPKLTAPELVCNVPALAISPSGTLNVPSFTLNVLAISIKVDGFVKTIFYHFLDALLKEKHGTKG